MSFVTVTSYPDAIEAHLARCQLEDAEIPCQLQDENIVNADWLYTVAVGGVKLQVPSEFVSQASEVLMHPQLPHEATQTYECPQCGSTNIEFARFKKRLAIAFVGFLGIPVLFGWLPLTCLECKRSWKPIQSESGERPLFIVILVLGVAAAVLLSWLAHARAP